MVPTRRRLFVALASALACAGFVDVGAARAQTVSPEKQQQIRDVGAVCRADIRTHCEGIQPGGGRIAACLGANRDKLSSDCRTAFDAIRRK